jgi:hypothetical protein
MASLVRQAQHGGSFEDLPTNFAKDLQHRLVAQQPVALPDVIPSHPHSGRWCTRKVFRFTPLRTSLMFMVGWSLRAVVMQSLTYFRLAGHLIFLPFASALHATVACFTAIS